MRGGPKRAQLPAAIVKRVRQLLAYGELSHREIGEALGVSKSAVSRVKALDLGTPDNSVSHRQPAGKVNAP